MNFRVFALNANVVLDFIDHASRARQMERLIAIFDETKYAILAVKINEVRRLELMLSHIGMGNLGLQVCDLIQLHGYSSLQRAQSPRRSASSISKTYSALSR